MKKVSISYKMFFIFLGFILFILFIGWFLITFFLQDYYEQQKVQTVKKYSYQIESAMYNEDIQTFKDEVDLICEKIGGSILIIDSNKNIEYAAGFMGMSGMNGMGGMGRIRRSVSTIDLDNIQDEKVYKIDFKQEASLIYVKKVYENYWFIFEIPFYSIQESVNIIQKFYGYIILIAIIISALLAFLFSKIVTKPLIKLNTIAKEIQRLNFSVKYEESRNDEIGHLGNTFNMMTEKLENTINKLTTELKKEKNLDNMRKQFVAQVSHELQTPISVIKGYAEALTDGIVDDKEEQDYYYEVIQYESNKMSKMIRELLDLSQLESGVFSIRKQKFDIMLLLNQVINKYKALCQEKNIQIKFNTDVKEFYVNADEIRIEQVITNFINNAMHHVDDKKYIEVNAYKTKGGVSISVFNSGKNISEKDMPYIWESFYKVKDSEQGTGLGLAISKSILQLHKYNYYVNNLQDGVEFSFVIIS